MSSPEETNDPVVNNQLASPDQEPQSADSEPVATAAEQPATPAPRPAPPPRAPFVPREERDRRRREALAGLQIGEWREGKVTGLAQFGAFVDLGGVDGLVHVSQLGTGGYVERVEDVVQVGQAVRVRVVEVDLDRGRVSLSMREPRAAAGPPRERPTAAAGAPPPRAPRPAAAGGQAPGWTPEAAPEPRHDRRPRGGGERPSANFRSEDRSPRRPDRARRNRDTEDEEWRSVRGDPRQYYFGYGDEEEEPAPTTAEELVARFGRKGTPKQ